MNTTKRTNEHQKIEKNKDNVRNSTDQRIVNKTRTYNQIEKTNCQRNQKKTKFMTKTASQKTIYNLYNMQSYNFLIWFILTLKLRGFSGCCTWFGDNVSSNNLGFFAAGVATKHRICQLKESIFILILTTIRLLFRLFTYSGFQHLTPFLTFSEICKQRQTNITSFDFSKRTPTGVITNQTCFT